MDRTIKNSFAVSICVAAVFLFFAAALSLNKAVAQHGDAVTATIGGTVTSASTGERIEGVRVLIKDANQDMPDVKLGETNSDGVIVFNTEAIEEYIPDVCTLNADGTEFGCPVPVDVPFRLTLKYLHPQYQEFIKEIDQKLKSEPNVSLDAVLKAKDDSNGTVVTISGAVADADNAHAIAGVKVYFDDQNPNIPEFLLGESSADGVIVFNTNGLEKYIPSCTLNADGTEFSCPIHYDIPLRFTARYDHPQYEENLKQIDQNLMSEPEVDLGVLLNQIESDQDDDSDDVNDDTDEDVDKDDDNSQDDGTDDNEDDDDEDEDQDNDGDDDKDDLNGDEGIPAGPECGKYSAGDEVPDGFASPYAVYSSAKEQLLRLICVTSLQSGIDIQLIAGSGHDEEFVYAKGYYSEGDEWRPITLNCLGGGDPVEGKWCRKQASTNVEALSVDGPRYLIGYVCRWVDGEWKCGCRDSACEKSNWNIQIAYPY